MTSGLSLRRFVAVVLCGAIVPAGLLARVGAQTTGKPERYNATAVNMGSRARVMAGRVLLPIDRWTTAKERENLLIIRSGSD